MTRWLSAWIVLASACNATCKPVETVPPAHTATLAFENVRVFDGERFVEHTTVLVDGDRIVAIGPGLPVPENAERVPTEGATLLPGLFDSHTHVHDVAQLEQALAFGVTTEIDMFALPGVIQPLRQQQSEGDAAGRADVTSAGILATCPGGHGTEYGLPIPTLDTPQAAQAFVDARLAEGSAFIKVVYDDGSGFHHSMPSIDQPTLVALIEAAHARDVLVVVHVSSQHEAIEAIEAGADGLAHLVLDEGPSEEFISTAAEHRVFVTDTLAVLMSVCDGTRGRRLAEDPRLAPYLSPDVRWNLLRSMPSASRPSCQPALRAAPELHRVGVRLLASTDAPNAGTEHGVSLHDELALLVEAGLSPTAALRSATSEPADVFGLDDRGRIAPGKRADLLLVGGDPRQDISQTRDIRGIWKQGVRFDRSVVAEVAAERQATVRAAMEVAPPTGSAQGLVSAFDDGQLRAEFGAGWQASTDAVRGGSSTVELEVVDGALRIVGTIAEASLPLAWSGAMFFPGERPLAAANLSSASTLVFRARGDSPLTVMVFAQRLGPVPASTLVPIDDEWKEYELPFDALVPEPFDVTAIFFGGPVRAGSFSVEIDDIRLR